MWKLIFEAHSIEKIIYWKEQPSDIDIGSVDGHKFTASDFTLCIDDIHTLCSILARKKETSLTNCLLFLMTVNVGRMWLNLRSISNLDIVDIYIYIFLITMSCTLIYTNFFFTKTKLKTSTKKVFMIIIIFIQFKHIIFNTFLLSYDVFYVSQDMKRPITNDLPHSHLFLLADRKNAVILGIKF